MGSFYSKLGKYQPPSGMTMNSFMEKHFAAYTLLDIEKCKVFIDEIAEDIKNKEKSVKTHMDLESIVIDRLAEKGLIRSKNIKYELKGGILYKDFREVYGMPRIINLD